MAGDRHDLTEARSGLSEITAHPRLVIHIGMREFSHNGSPSPTVNFTGKVYRPLIVGFRSPTAGDVPVTILGIKVNASTKPRLEPRARLN